MRTGAARQGNAIERQESMALRRLDSVFEEVTLGVPDPRVFLKMDTQGWDLDVVAGATGVLGRIDGMQSELSIRPIYDGMPNFETSIATFEDLGLRCRRSIR